MQAAGKQSITTVTGCIHGDGPVTDPALVCNKRTHLGFHGFLCLPHYREEQASIPVKKAPLRFQPRYKGFFQQELDCREIVASEKAVIANSKINRITFGVLEPIHLLVLEN